MPPLHPILVHFPIVLTILAGVFYLFALLGRNELVGKIGFILHAFSILLSIGAIMTGDYEATKIAETIAIHELAGTHETLAMVSTWGLGLLGIWVYLRHHSEVVAERLAFVLIFWGFIGILGYTAHIGGKMVFGHGAGVLPMQEHIKADPNGIEVIQP